MKKGNKEYILNKFRLEISLIKKRFDAVNHPLFLKPSLAGPVSDTTIRRIPTQSISTLEFIQIVNDLKNLLSNSRFIPILDLIRKDKKLTRLSKELRTVYLQHYIYQESKRAQDIILRGNGNPFVSNNNILGEKEAKFSNLNKKSHLFFIGSGPYPWTAINYATATGCKVTCIDNNPRAVFISKKLIKTLKLDDLIDIYCFDGQETNYNPATHITIAGMAQPKNTILKQISKTSNNNVKIIVRSSFNLYYFMYERINKDILLDFRLLHTINPEENSELISYIVTKKFEK